MDKPTLTPTSEQRHILDLLASTSSNLLINALAGSGKTSTLNLLQAAHPGPTLCLAFNKRIADEMAKRFRSTTSVRTLNSLGHRIWASACANRLSVDAKKCQDLLRESIRALPKPHQGDAYDQFYEILSAVGLAKSLGYVPHSKFPNAKRLIEAPEFFGHLDERPTSLTCDLIDEVLTSSIKAAYGGSIDFNDQVYMPALFGGTYPRFPLVLVDEAQDLSPVNHEMLNHLSRSRIVAVGDPHQCHPPGTFITTTKRGHRPIEDLKIGDLVATFDPCETVFRGLNSQGRIVEDISIQQFDGELITIQTNNKVLQVTPNHKCLIRIGNVDKYCVYLMRQDVRFRIGCCRLSYSGDFGPSMRARQECADALWILGTYSTQQAAEWDEHHLSGLFNISEARFYQEITSDDTIQGQKILAYFGKDPNLPIWSSKGRNYLGSKCSIVNAVNLIEGAMEVCENQDGTPTWKPFSLYREQYSGPVYGLTVQQAYGRRLYIANDIIVHNSIYGFRGATQNGMAKLKARFEMIEADLSVSFRCPSEIVKNAQWRVPHMTWAKEGGRVARLRNPSSNSFVDGAAIICRNNSPLFALALRLLAAGVSVSVSGSDVGPRIIGIMRRLGTDSTSQEALLNEIEAWRQEKLSRESKTADDIADCMRVFAGFGDTLGQAIAYAEHLFAQRGTLTLLTGHKAKGLEWPTVYALDMWLIGESEQERNLRYVIQTRAKENYYEVDSKEIRG